MTHELEIAGPSAVAVIETPQSFLLEDRPARPGALAYAGKLQLFGGHVEPGETPAEAIRRELREEISLDLDQTPPLIWGGEVNSQNRHGRNVRRQVSLFRVAVSSVADLRLMVPGDIAEVAKNLEALEAVRPRLTSFALESLTKVLTGQAWQGYQR